MNKQYQLSKKPYLPPRLVAVAFKVELGSASSFVDLSFPDGGGMSSYSSAANDGESFWDNDMSSPISSESYSNGNWSW